MKQTPLAWYEAKIQSGKMVADPYQRDIVLQFEKLFHEMLVQQSIIHRLKDRCYQWLGIHKKPVQGIYLWGSVGRGKTAIMDMFFHLLPFRHKERLHFHRFMQYVHQKLKLFQGEREPLFLVAKAFKAHTSIICFDEFYVTDIADAMILSELFRHMFSLGITLVATSNIPPNELYSNGLQREKFLPMIELIKQYTQVFSMDGVTDYRMQYLANAQLYQFPLDEKAEKSLMEYFLGLAQDEGESDQFLWILDRKIPTKWLAENIVWFDFHMLCEGARSALDYVQIARDFKTVILSNVMQMSEDKEDVARRFIALVDELYDHKVTLIMSAAVPLEGLYQGVRHRRDFHRTISRLTEMQSLDYLRERHLP